jgi:DNA-binding MarR family transcriptional regulator
MADQIPNASYLDEEAIRRGVELIYFGYGQLTRAADARLAGKGLGRAHHRALYFIARQPSLTVSDLLRLLNITKQSLARVINDLVRRDLIESRSGIEDRRQRLLSLTGQGAALEAELYDDLRTNLAPAYAKAGPDAVAGFWRVLRGLLPAD